MVKTYDPASWTLAEHFMQDRPQGMSDEDVQKFTHDLACHVQQMVEYWFQDRDCSGWYPLAGERR